MSGSHSPSLTVLTLLRRRSQAAKEADVFPIWYIIFIAVTVGFVVGNLCVKYKVPDPLTLLIAPCVGFGLYYTLYFIMH